MDHVAGKSMEKILEKIRDYADQAHGPQFRKYTPERYIAHPVRVMGWCKTVSNDASVLASALLHDVLEDTPVTETEIHDFLKPLMGNAAAEKTVKLVIELTDVYVKSNYPRLNRRERKAKELQRMKSISPEAQTVKYADIIDNCLEIVNHDLSFAAVFLKECRQILLVTESGDGSLRSEALKVVENGLKKLKGKSHTDISRQ